MSRWRHRVWARKVGAKAALVAATGHMREGGGSRDRSKGGEGRYGCQSKGRV